MTKKQIEDLSTKIVELIFKKLEEDARVMQGDPSDWLSNSLWTASTVSQF